MLVFWKKNEKEEIAARKKAEKEALDRAKAEEEAREAKRQSRKLNFLLTQTELYSHFIGKKIKTHEAEDTPDTAGKSSGGPDVPEGHEELGLDENGEPLPDIDYDDGESSVKRERLRRQQVAGRERDEKLMARRRGEPPTSCGSRRSGSCTRGSRSSSSFRRRKGQER
jgi:DNA helicase INO80